MPSGSTCRGGEPAGGSSSGESAGLETRHEVVARAVELGMDVTDDRKYFYLAAQALEASLPDGWEARQDAMGQPFYFNVAAGTSSREHPRNEEYRKTFFALKLKEVGYRRLMLSRVTSTHLADALAEMPEAEARRMESLFEQHDRDKDGVVNFEEFTKLSEEASARSGTKPIPPNKLRAIFVAADINHNGVVDFNEFCYAQQRKNANRKSRSRRSSPANSVAGSVAGDNDTPRTAASTHDTPRSWPNASPRNWPTPPMTPHDPLDSPSTHSVASTHSCLSDRSHYSESGHSFRSSHHEGSSHHSGHNAFADLLNGLLGGVDRAPSRSSRSQGPTAAPTNRPVATGSVS